MNKVFEKIIEKLEAYSDADESEQYGTIPVIELDRAIEIVKQEAEKYNNGHFGCNTNGEHEKCNGCWITDCKNRNKIWFGVSDDNNRWISSSESFPCESGYYLVTYHEWSNGDYLPKFDDTYVRRLHYQRSEHFAGWNYPHCIDERAETDTNREVIAWMHLPSPYQPKGEREVWFS